MIPYLRPSELRAGMSERPVRPFFVSPAEYTVLDGDTFMVMARLDGAVRGHEAFRIRFDAVNAPEKPVATPTDAILRAAGIEPHSGNPGVLARKVMKELCKGRALFVTPVRQPDGDFCDRYKRLIGHVWVSGSQGKLFDPEGARSAELHLYGSRLANIMPGRQLPPPTAPQIAAILAERSGPGPSPGL